MPNSPYMTAAETIVFLRLKSGQAGLTRLRYLVYKKQLPFVRCGIGMLFNRVAVEEWLVANSRKSFNCNLPCVKAARKRKKQTA